MKAVQMDGYGDPGVMTVREVEEPRPGPGQVLVEVKAAGVNPVDTYIRSGNYSIDVSFPHTPGMDGAGIVTSVGESVDQFSSGDRVYTSGSVTGTYASRAVCDQEDVHPLPEVASFEQGAALGVPYATAYRGLHHRGRGQFGEVLLVHGATGGVGIAAVQLGVASGLEVIGTGGTEEGRSLVLDQGAEHVVDHSSAGYERPIRDCAGERGVDLVLEMLANVNLERDLQLLADGGRIVVIGSRGTVEIDPRHTMSHNADIRGVGLLGTPPVDLQQIHRALFSGLRRGKLNPIIDRKFPLEEAATAHRRVLEDGHLGKIILVP